MKQHPWLWLLWLGTLVSVSWMTRNPFYLALLFLLVQLQYRAAAQQASRQPRLPAPIVGRVWIAWPMMLLSGLFNMLWTRVGDTVLFRLPASLPLVGGPFTLEAFAFGALNGAVLLIVLMAFITLNAALPMHDLIGLIPSAFHNIATIAGIALTYVPFTLRQINDIKEAQAVRGQHVRGIRDWLPLFVPLLTNGLERALALAEAMAARGFAANTSSTNSRVHRMMPWLLLSGLACASAGWLIMAWDTRVWQGPALLMLGLVLATVSIATLNRQQLRSRYRRHDWQWQDTASAGAFMIVVAFIHLPLLDRSSLFYYPYPVLSLPLFDPILGGLLLLLAVPVLLFGASPIPSEND